VGALTVDLVGSLGIVLAVVVVFSGVVVVGCIVVVGCVISIGVVVGIVRMAVSRIRPARMLAFSASRSMRCGGVVVGSGGGVGGVALVGAGGGVIGIVVGIGGIGVVGIVVREAVSRIKPARMLAFSALKSMCCAGTVIGKEGGGVVWVGSEGWNGSSRLFGVASQSMVVSLLDAWFVFVLFMFFIVME